MDNKAQEPVAWMAMDLHTSWLTFQKEAVKDAKEIIPLYTHPAPSFIGLSDDEIRSIEIDTRHFMVFARAIEQALRIKNEQTN